MSGEEAGEARPWRRRLLNGFLAAAISGATYALIAGYFTDGAVNRGWGENLLRGALSGLLLVATIGFIERRLQAKAERASPPRQPPD